MFEEWLDNHHDFDSHLAENDLSYLYDLLGWRLF